MVGMETNVHVFTLPNGLRVAVEPVPHAYSVAVGVWIGAGAHHERPGAAGAAHFLEHMLFKGTHRRSGRDLAQLMDQIGGEFNATTGREATSYYGWVLAEFWPRAVEILAELLLESRLDPEDVERERQVILEEIKGDEAVAEHQVMADFDRALWGTHPLGRPVAGTSRTVAAIRREHLLDLQQELYTPDNAVICLAGAVSPEDGLAAVSAAFGRWTGRRTRALPRAPRPRPGFRVRRWRADQAHLVVGAPAPAVGDPAQYPAMVLNTLMGGGAGSRLFQRIREDEALAYSVYTFYEASRLAGASAVYAAVRPDGVNRAATLIREEMARAAAETAPAEELERAKVQLRSSLVLNLESVSERMNRTGEHLTLLGRVVPPAEVLDQVAAVTAQEVLAAARAWLEAPRAVVAVGPVVRAALAEAANGIRA